MANVKLLRHKFLHLAAGAAALGILSVSMFGHSASSQPTRIIKLIVPYPAGGIADILARSLADQIGRSQGSTMIVENRPGASGDIGTEAASRATPDGKTLLIPGNSFLISPHLRKLK